VLLWREKEGSKREKVSMNRTIRSLLVSFRLAATIRSLLGFCLIDFEVEMATQQTTDSECMQKLRAWLVGQQGLEDPVVVETRAKELLTEWRVFSRTQGPKPKISTDLATFYRHLINTQQAAPPNSESVGQHVLLDSSNGQLASSG